MNICPHLGDGVGETVVLDLHIGVEDDVVSVVMDSQRARTELQSVAFAVN